MTSPSPAAARLQLAFDLYEAGEEMVRARLMRESPDTDPDEIERRIRDWLLDDRREALPTGFRPRPIP